MLKVLVLEERDFSRGTLYCTGSLPASVGWHRHSGHLFLPFPSHALEGDAWIVPSELYRCWATTFTFHSLNNGVMIAMRTAEHANRKHRCWTRPRVQILAFPQPGCAAWTTLQWRGASPCLAVLICEMDTGIEPASWGRCQGGAM